MRNCLFTLLGVLLLFIDLSGQNPSDMVKKIGDNPVYFIDSVRVDQSAIMNYAPTQIASLSIYKEGDAIELMGDEGKDGVIYIETKSFASIRFWKYFRQKSAEYARLVKTPAPNTKIQYILNDKVLIQDFEGDLSLINDSIFQELRIISRGKLKKEYKIKGKDFGVLIKSGKPGKLYNEDKKF